MKIIDEGETQKEKKGRKKKKKKRKKTTRVTQAIAKGWEINDFVECSTNTQSFFNF